MAMRPGLDEAPLPPASRRASERASVVIVTYNGAQHVRPCLSSLVASGVEPSQVLVVDNASRDGTVEEIRQSFPRVRILPGRQNVGYGVAVNRGASITTSEYLVVMNQDVVSAEGWIDRLTEVLEADPTVALATPKIVLKADPSRINACGNSPHYTGITTCRGYGRPTDELSHGEDVAAVSGAAFAVRAAVFEALGGFDPDFFLYLEDTDLSLRATLAGYRSVCVPAAVVMHDFEPRFSADKLFFLERNRHLMLLKLYRWRTWLTLGPALLLAEAAVWGYALLGGPSRVSAKARAYDWLLRHRRCIRDSRRRTQLTRRVSDRVLLAGCADELQLGELDSVPGRLAMSTLNPLFRFWYRVAGRVIRW